MGSPPRQKVLLYFYNRLFDPVIQSNFWLYVQDFLGDPSNPYEFHLITYEDDNHPPTVEQQRLVALWQSQGLSWTPLVWHRGPGLLNKLKDVWSGFATVARLRLGGYKHIVSLNSVAGAFAYLYSVALRLKLYMYQYEPHSEYAVDNGIWTKESLQYRIAHYLERKSADFATVVSSGTCFMQDRLEREWRIPGYFFKVPSVVNSDKFTPDLNIRSKLREQWGITERWVLFYPGKFGDLYYREELAWAYRWLHEEEPRFFLVIVTPHSDDEVHALFDGAGVPRDSYRIAHSDYSDIQNYYCASDFGIISVPPGPSKRFISNIKVGEYLCAGLPYLIVRGVSEDYVYAEEKGVGVVVQDFSKPEILAALPQIRAYFERDPEELRDHCRQVGLDYRGFASLKPVVEEALCRLVESDHRSVP